MRVLISILLLLYLGCKYPRRNKDIVLGNWQYVALRDSTQTLDLTLDSLTISFGLNGKFEFHCRESTMYGFYKTNQSNKFNYIYLPLDIRVSYLYSQYPNKIVNLGIPMSKNNTEVFRKCLVHNDYYVILKLRNEKFKIINDSLIITYKWYHQRTSVLKRIP